MKTWRIVLIILAVGAIIAAAAVYYVYNKPHRDISKEKVDYELSAGEFAAEFDVDADTAHQKYDTKVVKVTGHIEDVSLTHDNRVQLLLKGGIKAALKDSTIGPENFRNNDEVTMKCLYTGYDDLFNEITLKDCDLSTNE